MAEQVGEVLTAPFSPQANASGSGEILTFPPKPQAAQSTNGEVLIAIAGGLPVIVNYVLACFDNGNVRHYWVDTEVSLTNAPVIPGTYVAATLLVLKQY